MDMEDISDLTTSFKNYLYCIAKSKHSSEADSCYTGVFTSN